MHNQGQLQEHSLPMCNESRTTPLPRQPGEEATPPGTALAPIPLWGPKCNDHGRSSRQQVDQAKTANRPPLDNTQANAEHPPGTSSPFSPSEADT